MKQLPHGKFEPVSYTHLDVYKRQVLSDVRARADALAQRFGEGDYDMVAIVTYDRTATVTADALWLRKAPSTSAATLDKLAKGTHLSVLSEDCLLYTSRCV